MLDRECLGKEAALLLRCAVRTLHQLKNTRAIAWKTFLTAQDWKQIVPSWFAITSFRMWAVLGDLQVPDFCMKGFWGRIGCYCMWLINYRQPLSVLLMPLLWKEVAPLPTHPHSKAWGTWKVNHKVFYFLQENRTKWDQHPNNFLIRSQVSSYRDGGLWQQEPQKFMHKKIYSWHFSFSQLGRAGHNFKPFQRWQEHASASTTRTQRIHPQHWCLWGESPSAELMSMSLLLALVLWALIQGNWDCGGEGSDALNHLWCQGLFTVSYSGRNSTHVPCWQDRRCSAWWPTATVVVTARWQLYAGGCCSRDRFAAIRGLLQSPGGFGLFCCLLGGLLHQKDEDIKCLIHGNCRSKAMQQGSGPPSAPSLPAHCLPTLLSLLEVRPGVLHALPLSPQVPYLNKTPLQGHAVLSRCQEHLVVWSTTWLVASRQGAALGTLRMRELTGKAMTSPLRRGNDCRHVFYGYSVSGGFWLLFLDLRLQVSTKTCPRTLQVCECSAQQRGSSVEFGRLLFKLAPG